MSTITVPTAFNIDLEFRIAAFHKRLLAWVIDLLVISAFLYVMFRLAIPLLGMEEYFADAAAMLFVIVPAFSYHLWMELFFNGRSLGKMAMGIKVMDITGKEATLSQYLLRWVLRMVDVGATMGAGAVLSIALTNYNQRLGDIVAGTIVIDERAQTGLHQTIYLDIDEKDYKVLFPQVMRLTDRDINGIRSLLDMREGSSENAQYMQQISNRIREVLSIETDMEPREFLHQLLSDYNFLTGK